MIVVTIIALLLSILGVTITMGIESARTSATKAAIAAVGAALQNYKRDFGYWPDPTVGKNMALARVPDQSGGGGAYVTLQSVTTNERETLYFFLTLPLGGRDKTWGPYLDSNDAYDFSRSHSKLEGGHAVASSNRVFSDGWDGPIIYAQRQYTVSGKSIPFVTLRSYGPDSAVDTSTTPPSDPNYPGDDLEPWQNEGSWN